MDKNLAQKQLEGAPKNFFYEYVKTELKKMHDHHDVMPIFETILSKVSENKFVIPLNKNEFELLGIFSFLVGQDYLQQPFPQKKILENVFARFLEVEIEDEEFGIYDQIMILFNGKESVAEYFQEVLDHSKNHIKDYVEVPLKDKMLLKQLKAKLNKFLDIAIIPIGFAMSLSELRSSELTYENLLKINSLLQEQSSFSGSNVEKLTAVYADPLFDSLLKKSVDVLNEAKYALLYEDSILNVGNSLSNFPLIIYPDFYTEEKYAQMKEKFEEEQTKKLTESEDAKDAEKDSLEFNEKFTQEQTKQMMLTSPDEFVIKSLQDVTKKQITNTEDIPLFIDAMIASEDHIQHMYTYMAQYLQNGNRVIGKTYLPNGIDCDELTQLLNARVIKCGERYKELAEINCAEINPEQKNRIVTYVNDCIKACILRNSEQKQYLVSQLIENQINTWEHLKQIFSIIETCEINGGDCLTYVNLYNYIQDKSNISEMFDNGKEMDKIQIEMSVFRAFREWFKFHLPVEEKTTDNEN